MDLVQSAWNAATRATNAATRITAKLKLLRRVLKEMEQESWATFKSYQGVQHYPCYLGQARGAKASISAGEKLQNNTKGTYHEATQIPKGILDEKVHY